MMKDVGFIHAHFHAAGCTVPLKMKDVRFFLANFHAAGRAVPLRMTDNSGSFTLT